jgi:hypothetical protein
MRNMSRRLRGGEKGVSVIRQEIEEKDSPPDLTLQISRHKKADVKSASSF